MEHNNEWLISKTVSGLFQLEKEYHLAVNSDNVELAEEKLNLINHLEQRVKRLNGFKINLKKDDKN